MHVPSVCEKLEVAPLVVQTTDGAALDCALRLMRLLDHPEVIPVLHLSILRELHCWLLAGEHGAMLRSLALPDSNSNRLAASIALLRTEFRSKISVSRLADAAAMSLTSSTLGSTADSVDADPVPEAPATHRSPSTAGARRIVGEPGSVRCRI